MHRFYRTLVLTMILAVLALSAIAPAFAGVEGRKNTAIVLTGATIYSFMTKNDRAAVVGALGSAAAWKNYDDARKKSSRQRSQAYHPAVHRTTRSYSRPKSYTASHSAGYARPASYTQSASTAQISELKNKLAKLETQNVELKRQTQISQLQAQNESLKQELDRQKTLVAGVKSDVAASRLHSWITAIIAVLAIGLMLGIGKFTKFGK